MNKQVILIETYPTYWRAAYLVDGFVQAFDWILLDQKACLGDQFLGRVVATDSQFSYIELGLERPALLPMPKQVGELVAVEVTREALDDKGEERQKKAVRLKEIPFTLEKVSSPTLLQKGKKDFEVWLQKRDSCTVMLTSRRLKEELESLYPSHQYDYRRLEEEPFNVWGVEPIWESVLEQKVFLPSGGNIIFERTAVGLTIDINEGQGQLRQVNQEACSEIARQLCLRGEGGNMIIDFPFEPDGKKKIIASLQKAFTEWNVIPKKDFWSPMGWYEVRLPWRRQPFEQKLKEIRK